MTHQGDRDHHSRDQGIVAKPLQVVSRAHPRRESFASRTSLGKPVIPRSDSLACLCLRECWQARLTPLVFAPFPPPPSPSGSAIDSAGPGVRPPHIPDFFPPLPPGMRYKRRRPESSDSKQNLTEVGPPR